MTNTCAAPHVSCPACRSARVCRAEYEGIVEQAILRAVDICPFVCQACGMRFYLFLIESAELRPEPLRAWLDAEECKTIVSTN